MNHFPRGISGLVLISLLFSFLTAQLQYGTGSFQLQHRQHSWNRNRQRRRVYHHCRRRGYAKKEKQKTANHTRFRGSGPCSIT